MNFNDKILVAGSNGMVGSAIVRNLKQKGYRNVIPATRQWVNFTNQNDTNIFFESIKPEYVFLSAAKVGGIMANKTNPAEFIYDNLMIQSNIIHASLYNKVKKVLFLGSSCIYPKFATQPITEDQLMSGPLEPTNDAYAIAKIAGIKLCQAYSQQYGMNIVSLMPTNLYGPNDNFSIHEGHVLAALLKKIHDAKISNKPTVECWGDGSSMREFLHVDDLAEACYFCMLNYDSSDILNVGTGIDMTIKDLVNVIANIIGYEGEFVWDTTKPNGTPRKVLNVDKIKNIGWEPKIELNFGIQETYNWYKENEI
jgi:GDP-L-fucose synthase